MLGGEVEVILVADQNIGHSYIHTFFIFCHQFRTLQYCACLEFSGLQMDFCTFWITIWEVFCFVPAILHRIKAMHTYAHTYICNMIHFQDGRHLGDLHQQNALGSWILFCLPTVWNISIYMLSLLGISYIYCAAQNEDIS